jgi:UDP-N-acetylmuramoyl-tripeptide--D-alanyl-D-alanine ligase
MEAAIKSFNGLTAGNKVLIAGEMLELGSASDSEHEAVLKLIDNSGINRIFLVGPVFHRLKVRGNYLLFNDSVELADYLRDNPITGSSILVKGSRLIELEKVVPFL